MLAVGSKEFARTLKAFRHSSARKCFPWEMQLKRDLPRFWEQIEQAINDSIVDIADTSKRDCEREALNELFSWILGPLYYRFASSGVKLSTVIISAGEHL